MTDAHSPDQQGRRSFLRQSALAATGMAAIATALSPLLEVDDYPSLGDFVRKHYKEMDEQDLEEILRGIQEDVQEKFGVDATVTADKPLPGVEFVTVLNLSRCIGCRKCVYACVEENNQSRDPQIQYIRVLEMPNGTFDLEQSNHDYDPETVPREGHFYMPVQCHQCRKPPCVKVCPVEATWQEADGITVVDYDWCIGCRYCEAACPYWARRFNFAKPEIPAEDINPNMSYLGNRPRPMGVVEKCHNCLQRTRNGRYPACLEACPTGARKFGNVLDPSSEVARILKDKRVFVLKEEAGTRPRFFYYFDV